METEFDQLRLGDLKKNINEQSGISTRVATIADAEAYKAIRLEAIENEARLLLIGPEDKKAEYAKTREDWEKDLTDDNQFVILSQSSSEPVGMFRAVSNVS